MPVYTYQCTLCLNETELFLPIQDYDKSQKCSCGGLAMKTYSCYNTGGSTVLSAKEKENLSIPFGKKSAYSFNTIKDVEEHIKKKNKEYGMNIDIVGNNY